MFYTFTIIVYVFGVKFFIFGINLIIREITIVFISLFLNQNPQAHRWICELHP